MRSKETEQAARLVSAVELAERLQRIGLTLNDARTLQQCLSRPNDALPPALLTKLRWDHPPAPIPEAPPMNQPEDRSDGEGLDYVGPEIDESDLAYEVTEVTTAGMVGQLNEIVARFDAKISEEIESLSLTSSPVARAALVSSQAAWLEFRQADCAYARTTFEGGTAAPLASGVRAADLSIERLRSLRMARAERESR